MSAIRCVKSRNRPWHVMTTQGFIVIVFLFDERLALSGQSISQILVYPITNGINSARLSARLRICRVSPRRRLAFLFFAAHADYGLRWIHSPVPVAHPLDDGTAIALERDLDDAGKSLGKDGKTWRNLMRPFVEHWSEFAPEVFRPVPAIPRHPWLMARFEVTVLLSAKTIASRFRSERTSALFAGLAAHSVLSLDELLRGAFGMLMAVSAHAVGWPIPQMGAQSIINALCHYLSELGSTNKTSSRVDSLVSLQDYDAILCDVTHNNFSKSLANACRRPTSVAWSAFATARRIQSRLRAKRSHSVESLRVCACSHRAPGR
jgi:hypothetical protein